MATNYEFCQAIKLDDDLVRNIEAISRDPVAVQVRRRRAFEFWEGRAKKLEPLRQKVARGLPRRMQATVKKLHLPLLAEMCTAADHEDTNLVADIMFGFKVTGTLDAGGVGQWIEGGVGTHGRPLHNNVPDLQELRSRCAEINARTLQNARPDALAESVWSKVKEEIKEEKIGKPVPVDDVDLDRILLVHRFGIEQVSSTGSKLRCIDNFAKNEANSFAAMAESTRNDREDVVSEAILSLQRGLYQAGREGRVKVGLEDFKSAFKTVAPVEDQRWLMYALVWDSDENRWVVVELLTMPFGAVGGVLSWYRCAMAQRAIMRRLFEMIVCYYVDDVHVIDVDELADEAGALFRDVMNLLGWELDPEKSQAMGDEVRSLGCGLEVLREGVEWSLLEDKAERWDKELEEMQDEGEVPPEAAGRMFGKLGFGSQRVFARCGRAALRQFLWRQHSFTCRMTKRLASAIRWWRGVLNPKALEEVGRLEERAGKSRCRSLHRCGIQRERRSSVRHATRRGMSLRAVKSTSGNSEAVVKKSDPDKRL